MFTFDDEDEAGIGWIIVAPIAGAIAAVAVVAVVVLFALIGGGVFDGESAAAGESTEAADEGEAGDEGEAAGETDESDESAEGESDGAALTDDEISPAVRAALDGAGYDTIAFGVENGKVTLTGEVDSEADRDAAEAAVASLEGVTEVDNQMTIAVQSVPAGATVTVEDGQIVLTGTVPDEATRADLVARAEAEFGDDVVDQLEIDESSVLEGATIVLEGELADEASVAGVRSAYEGIEADGFTIEDRLTVAVPVENALTSSLNELFELAPIQFVVNSATISADSLPTLDNAVQVLTDNPEGGLVVGGHTDSDGDEAANQTLSEARAQAVVDYLVGGGVDGTRLTATGFGSSVPEASNDTPEGQAQNRRIEFTPAG